MKEFSAKPESSLFTSSKSRILYVLGKMRQFACYLLTSRAVVFSNDFSHGLIFNTFFSLQWNPLIKYKGAHRGETRLMLFWYNGRTEC